jgi:hypothetical protein
MKCLLLCSGSSLAVVSEILQGRNARRNVYLALALLIRSLYEVLVTMQWLKVFIVPKLSRV